MFNYKLSIKIKIGGSSNMLCLLLQHHLINKPQYSIDRKEAKLKLKHINVKKSEYNLLRSEHFLKKI